MRREKYCPNGGPDGGDGGRGGHIILRGNRNYWTLLHLKYDRHAMAGHGESGSKGRSFGKDGADKVIEVPCGTVVYNAETGEYLCDVTEDGQEVILLKGGRGGQGNWHFKTATRQAPRFAQPGEPKGPTSRRAATVRRHAQDDEGRGRRRHEDAQDAGRDDAAIVLYKDRAGSKACLICLHADVSNSTLRKITEKSSPSPKENV